MKILIAEDDAVSLMVLKNALEKWGHEVCLASGGAEAWELFDHDPVRVIVSDWMMPGMDGLDFCRKVRERPNTDYTYFILVTAKEGVESYQRAMDLGVDDFLGKPLNFDELAIRLRVADRILGYTTHIRQLESLLPICMYCKKIRDEKENWQPVESYITQRTETSFSHGICPSCYESRAKPMLEQYRKAHS